MRSFLLGGKTDGAFNIPFRVDVKRPVKYELSIYKDSYEMFEDGTPFGFLEQGEFKIEYINAYDANWWAMVNVPSMMQVKFVPNQNFFDYLVEYLSSDILDVVNAGDRTDYNVVHELDGYPSYLSELELYNTRLSDEWGLPLLSLMSVDDMWAQDIGIDFTDGPWVWEWVFGVMFKVREVK